MKNHALLWATLAVALVACDSGDATIRGRAKDPCLRSLSACPPVFASCVLDPTRFAEVWFPGDFRFLVEADADSGIEVSMYFVEQIDAGLKTEIYWNEPGCSDFKHYDSGGLDLFAAAEGTNVFSQRRTVLERGEHLIEIFSDMQALVLVAVDVIPRR